MSNESREEKQQESAFIGEISSHSYLNNEATNIVFQMRSLQDGPVDYGAAELITRSDTVYPVVIRAILQPEISVSEPNRENTKEQRVVVDGISFAQAPQMHRLVQKQEPKILSFVGEARNPFLSSTITRGFVGFQIGPILQSDLLNPYGVFRPYGKIQLLSKSNEVYSVTIRGSGRALFDMSTSDKMWHRDIAVDGITLDQAQNVHRIIQLMGPQGTTAIGAILSAKYSHDTMDHIDLRVRMLQYGLMRKGRGIAQLVNISGERYSVIIRHIAAVPSPNTSLETKKHDYLISVDGITSGQAEALQTLVQVSEPLDYQ